MSKRNCHRQAQLLAALELRLADAESVLQEHAAELDSIQSVMMRACETAGIPVTPVLPAWAYFRALEGDGLGGGPPSRLRLISGS